ncbi:MAG: hypothetical protein LBB23_02625 [Rickettsiales bacterium]|nr:hypothetical protein [Rickettsiales bacterium]
MHEIYYPLTRDYDHYPGTSCHPFASEGDFVRLTKTQPPRLGRAEAPLQLGGEFYFAGIPRSSRGMTYYKYSRLRGNDKKTWG